MKLGRDYSPVSNTVFCYLTNKSAFTAFFDTGLLKGLPALTHQHIVDCHK